MAISTIDALYNGTSEKLTTSATGIDVTGTVTSDGLTVTQSGSTFTPSGQTVALFQRNSASGSGAKVCILAGNQSSSDLNFGDVDNEDQGAIKYEHNNDAMTFTTNGSERMRLDSSGRVTKPNQPYFCIHSPGQSNITVGGYTLITLNQEEVDTGSNFSNNTFTAPVTGVYSLTLLIRLDDVMANSSYYNTSINTSNRSYPLLFSPNGFDTNVNYWQFTINVIADMDAGDTASCNVGQIGGSSGTDINNSTRFMGYLLG